VDPVAGERAFLAWLADPDAASEEVTALAVRFTLEELAARAPGRATEVRVPPHGAVQCLPGPQHSRGTPSNVVETDPRTWLLLAAGRLAWADGVASGAVTASGLRADLSGLFPVTVVDRPHR
jgi:hypothetical protein